MRLFMDHGSWAAGTSHSTATLSPGGPRGLYGLRLVHRLNIFLSCFGPRAGQAVLFCPFALLTLTLWHLALLRKLFQSILSRGVVTLLLSLISLA